MLLNPIDLLLYVIFIKFRKEFESNKRCLSLRKHRFYLEGFSREEF